MENNLQIIPAEDVKTLVETLPVALELNTNSVIKAEGVGQTLLDTIEAEGMNDELDAKVNDYLVKIDKTLENVESRRKPTTTLFDKVKSAFTALEARLNKKKEGSIPFKLQEQRNAYVTRKAQEEKERQRKIQEDKDRSLERIELKRNAQDQLRNGFSVYVRSILDKLNADLERVTLEKYDAAVKYFTEFNMLYPRGHFDSIKVTLMRRLVADQDLNEIIDAAKAEVYDSCSQEFTKVIAERKVEILDLLPGKKKQLEEDAAEIKRRAEAAEKAMKVDAQKAAEARARVEIYTQKLINIGYITENDKIYSKGGYSVTTDQLMGMEEVDFMNWIAEIEERIAADIKRKADQDARDKADQDARDKKAADDAAMKAQEAQTNTLFDAVVESVPMEESAKTRESLEIIVTGPQGWMQIVSQWFLIEGAKMSLDKFEKKTLGSMKTACEKHAFKGGDRITHAHIQYKEVFKAVTSKA